MTPRKRATLKEAMAHIGITNKETFYWFREAYGFVVYAGPKGDEYDLDDVTKKFNTPKEKLNEKVLKQI